MALEGTFTPGGRLTGRLTGKGNNHLAVELAVERVEPEEVLSYRWHPYAVETGVDYTHEPMTLVEFHLAEVAEGTRLTVVESGFENIPLARRATAFGMNSRGWAAQLDNIARYVAA